MTVGTSARRPRPTSGRFAPGSVGRRRGLWVAAALFLAGVALAVYLVARPTVKRLLTPAVCTVTAPSGTFILAASQARYAATIAAVGVRDGLPDHAVSVALATALQESKLADLDYGDQDSLGLFQQRPSQGWGTADDVMDPVYSANAFYQALAKVPGWLDLSVTEAAQAVQHSGAPGAYEQWAGEGRALAEAFTGEAPAALACSYSPSGTGRVSTVAERSTTATVNPATAVTLVNAAVTTELGGPLPGQAVTSSTEGWRLASWLVARGQGFGLSQVSFEGWVWKAKSGHWVAAAVPSLEQVNYATPATTTSG